MIRRSLQCLVAYLATVATPVIAAPFVNLNFEQATVPPGTPDGSLISASIAFPGWTPRAYGSALSNVYYDLMSADFATVALDDSAFHSAPPPPEGAYYATLFYDSSSGGHSSISQTGTIPAGTKSVQLLSDEFLGSPRVWIGGWEVSLSRLASGPSFFARYGGDVSSFAGQTVELELRDRQGVTRLDSVMFSTQQVPEMSLAGPAVLVSVCIAKAMRRAGR
jgi:hypothetical protein